jgi:hypothetical protein
MVVLALLAIPGAALAATALPKSGHWKITGAGAGSGGSFKISRKYVYDFTIPGTNCSLTTVTVEGRQKLRLIASGGYSNWVIGTSDPSRKNPNDIGGVVGLAVKIRVAGKVMSARLEITLGILGNKLDNTGDLRVNGCDIPFNAEP